MKTATTHKTPHAQQKKAAPAKKLHKVPKRKITTTAMNGLTKPPTQHHKSTINNMTPFAQQTRESKIEAGNLKVGYVIQYGDENKPFKVTGVDRRMQGRRATAMLLTLKCLATGKTFPQRMTPDAVVESFDLEPKTLSFLYADGEIGAMMDNDTFEQHEFPVLQFFTETSKKWIPADQNLMCYFYNGELFSVVPPEYITMQIKHIDINPPTTRVSGSDYKQVIMQNDLPLSVPAFMEVGQHCKIRFEDLQFHSRVNSV